MTIQDVSVRRELLHSRNIECKGYARDDGLWDIEGRVADIRTIDCLDRQGGVLVRAGDVLHGMLLRITVDAAMRIVDASAITTDSPHGECKSVSTAYAVLIGLTIGPGFLREVKDRFRGVRGCTHMTELIGPVATTAFQTVMARRDGIGVSAPTSANQSKRPPMLKLVDSCHAWRRGGEAFVAHIGQENQ